MTLQNILKTIGLIAVGSVLALPIIAPVFAPTFFPLHDYTHVARLAEMDRALVEGHFPVRWSRNLGFGYGMAQFTFYAPLPYYIAEVFHGLGLSYLDSIRALLIVTVLASFWALYSLGKLLWGRWAGLLCGVAFLYAPYRAVDMYVRGAYGELTAITFTAVALYCLVLWLKRPRLSSLMWFSLALSGVISSHNLTAMMALPCLTLVLVGGLIASPHRSWKQFAAGGGGVLLGIGIAAFYAVPAYFEKGFTKADLLTQGFSHYSQHFLYLRQLWQSPWGYGGSIYGLADNISFEIGKLQMVGGFIAGVAALLALRRKRSFSAALVLVSGVCVAGSIWMSTFKSQWVWDHLTFLSYIQFPWRFLTMIIVFNAAMIGGVMLLPLTSWMRGFIAIVAIAGLIGVNSSFFKPEKYLEQAEILYYSDPARIQKDMSGVIPDFMPKITATPPITPAENRFMFEGGVAHDLQVWVDRGHEFCISVVPEGPVTLVLNIWYFPGWEVKVNDVVVTPLVDPDSGVMRVPLNSLDGAMVTITGQFKETPLRRIADGVSVVCLLIVGFGLLTSTQQGTRRGRT